MTMLSPPHISRRLVKRWATAGSVCIGIFLVSAGVGATTTVRPPPADPRDISGVWFVNPHVNNNFNAFKPIEGGDPPLTEEGLEIYKARQAAEDNGDPNRTDPPTNCWPSGVPLVAVLPEGPFEIIQTPGQVTFVYEAYHDRRIIYLDEKQAVNPPRTFMGHSVGHWEDDTLVVDTIGMRPENWLDLKGAPEGIDTHIVEHIKKIKEGVVLEDLFTITDPRYYTKPWTTRREWIWSPKTRLGEYVCEENTRLEIGLKPSAVDKIKSKAK